MREDGGPVLQGHRREATQLAVLDLDLTFRGKRQCANVPYDVVMKNTRMEASFKKYIHSGAVAWNSVCDSYPSIHIWE